MGLDLVEFVMSVEEAFELRFPDEDLPAITTPRRLINYVAARLPRAASPADSVCPSQRVFYHLRSALAARLGCPRSTLRPGTPLLALIPAEARAATWEAVREDIGVASTRKWPRLESPAWLDMFFVDFYRPRVGNLRQATRHIVAWMPRVAKQLETGWTRSEIAEVVYRLIEQQFGLRRHEYTDDSHWDRDMGIY